jgi:hypothetical protein
MTTIKCGATLRVSPGQYCKHSKLQLEAEAEAELSIGR